MIKPLSILIFSMALAVGLFGQDKIYYKQNKTDNWKVTNITPDNIKATDPVSEQVAYSTTPANVLFIFNDLGNFLVIPKLFEKSAAQDYIENFFKKASGSFNEYDKIITVQNNIIICKYEKENGKKIEYTAANKLTQLSKSEIAIIIFKNGQHKLVASADKVYKVLSDVQDLYTDLAYNSQQPADKASADTLKDKLLAEKEMVKKNSADAVQENTVDSPATTAPVAGPGPGNSSPLKTEKKLDSVILLKLQDKAIQNIKQLESYIILVSNKNTDADMVSRSIDQALTLFVNEDARIEVSSATNGSVQPYKIKIYLNRLSALNYDRVNIQWYNVQYTSQLRKGTDGNYYGVIEFEQRFTGISNDKRVYQDITRKTVEIILKTYKRNVSGESTLEWDVFLGNIGITETKPA